MAIQALTQAPVAPPQARQVLMLACHLNGEFVQQNVARAQRSLVVFAHVATLAAQDGALGALVDHAADLLGAHLGTGAPGAASPPRSRTLSKPS